MGVIVLLAVVGRFGWAYYQVVKEKNAAAQLPVAHDIAPIDDADLLLPKVVIADSDNAYFDLVKIDKVIYWPKEKSQAINDMVAGKIVWDEKLAQELISKNTEAFKYFTDASLKPKFQDITYADPINIDPNAPLLPLNSSRNMAILGAVKALSFSKQGKDKEATEEAMRSVSIGQKMQDSQGALIQYLVAMAMKGIGLRTTEKVLSTSKFKTSELKKYSQQIDGYYKNEEGLILALKAEHYFSFSSLDLLTLDLVGGNKEAAGFVNETIVAYNPDLGNILDKFPGIYYFEPNKTKLLYAEYFRSQIDDANRQCWDMHGFSVKELDVSSFENLKKVENAIGIILRDVTSKSMNNLLNKKCQEDALVGVTQTLFALKAFKNDTKKYPTTLEVLVPKYLDVVPTDPFDGKQLKYSAEKKIIYSVGADKKDDGGVTNDSATSSPDIVYSIGF